MRRQALKARLLVPVCLAAGMALYNSQAEKPVGGAEEFSLLGGFLSYKVKQTEDSLLPVLCITRCCGRKPECCRM